MKWWKVHLGLEKLVGCTASQGSAHAIKWQRNKVISLGLHLDSNSLPWQPGPGRCLPSSGLCSPARFFLCSWPSTKFRHLIFVLLRSSSLNHCAGALTRICLRRTPSGGFSGSQQYNRRQAAWRTVRIDVYTCVYLCIVLFGFLYWLIFFH